MKSPLPATRLRRGIAALALCTAVVTPAFAQQRPEPLQALEARGLTIVGTLPSQGGLTAYAGYTGRHPVALYVTPDGKHVVAGTLFDAAGNDLTHAALEKAVAGPMSDALWHRLAASTWIADGRSGAARVVYVFTDPNCPYCNKLWSDARPWVTAGKVQLRHVIVGILTPTSAGKAAALLASKDPSATLAAYESRNATATARALAAGHPRPLDDHGLQPPATIAAAQQQELAANEHLMASLGLEATPGIVWRDAEGKLQMREGEPGGSLDAILGPR